MLSLYLASASEAATHSNIAQTVHIVVGLIALAVLVGVASKVTRLPYTAALVVTGLVIAAFGLAPEGVHINEDLVLLIFLPPLLFQAGLHLDLDLLKRVWLPVVILAVPGVVVSSALVAVVAKPFLEHHMGSELPIAAVLLFGVIMAPTDPISVMATFKTAGVPKKLKTVVEGESLFNDGTAVAFFAVLKPAALVMLASGIGGSEEVGGGGGGGVGAEISVMEVVWSFAVMAGGGTVLGLALGVAASWVLHKLNDHTLETAITVALAWGAFVLGESLHVSGVICVVVAGLIVGNFGKTLCMSKQTRTTVTGFWDSLDFLVNSVLFLLIGFELSDPKGVGGVSRLIEPDVLLAAASVFLVLVAARALVTYPVVMAFKGYWPRGWKHVMAWAGLKGSLSLALILGLPREGQMGELRSFMIAVAFIVVLVSLLGQGLTMPKLLKRVPMGDPEKWGGI